MACKEIAAAVPPTSADEKRDAFIAAQRRRLLKRGLAFWLDTDLPPDGLLWPQKLPPAKIE
jgi:hypothetical protein